MVANPTITNIIFCSYRDNWKRDLRTWYNYQQKPAEAESQRKAIFRFKQGQENRPPFLNTSYKEENLHKLRIVINAIIQIISFC